MRKKICPPQNFSPKLRIFFTFCDLVNRTPTGRKSQNTGFLGPFGLGQPLALEEIPGRKQKTRNFPELGALLRGKSVRPKSFSPKLRNFLTVCVLVDWTSGGGKSQNTGFSGPLGLGQPLAHREIPGGKQKNENSQIETKNRQTNPLQLGPNTQS